jgi:hypothetical protein
VKSSLPSTFEGYKEVRYGLLGDLQRVEEIAAEWQLPELHSRAAGLRGLVGSSRFTVAVLGEFKRGKSTFLNALLGEALLPADILPTTAAINRVVYGLRRSARLAFRDGRPDEVIAIEELGDKVTKLSEASTAIAATLKEAVITCPTRFCQQGDVELLDTPGLADEEAMTAVTLGVLPQVDLALFVMMADSPFSASEARFLEQIQEAAPSRVVFVVTALDRIRRASDRERVLDSIRARLAEVVPEPQVFGISGQDALDAREDKDDALLAGSGLPALEDWLEGFLARSDAMGLRRRLVQTRALCEELSRAGVQRRERLEAQRAGLAASRGADEALLEAIRQALDRGREQVSSEAARAGVPRRYADQLSQALAAELDALVAREEHIHDLAQAGGYPAAAERIARELWLNLVQPFCAVITPYGLGLSEELAPALQRLEHLGIACDEVMGHLARRLDERPPPSLAGRIEVQLELLRPPPDAETLRVGKVANALLPSRDQLEAALMDSSLRSGLEQQAPRDFFGQFSSLLNNPTRAWKEAARAALEQVFTDHWERSSPEHVLRSWTRELVSVTAQPLSQGQALCRKGRASLETRQQRMDALIERDQADLERQLRALDLVASRAGQLSDDEALA